MARRRELIALARRRQRPGTGSTEAFLMERTARFRWPELTEVLGSVPWGLVLMKLQASRAQDEAGLARMLGQAGEAALAAFRDLVARERPQDREDLESLVDLGRLELQPPP